MKDFDKQFKSFIDSGDLDKAEKLLDKTPFDRKRKDFHQGRILLKRGHYKDLVNLLRPHTLDLTAADISPGILQLMGTALLHLNNGKESVKYLKLALQLDPKNITARSLLLNALLDTADFDQALLTAQDGKKQSPENIEFLLSEAAALKGLMRPLDALTALEEILQKRPTNRVAKRLQADIFAETDSRLGVRLYENLLSDERPEGPDIQLRWNSCIHFLRARNFSKGWQYWELGFHKDVGTMGRQIPQQLRTEVRVDSSEKTSEGWVLLCAEQGIGDQILFMSAFNEFVDEYQKVIVAAEYRMQTIFQRAFPRAFFTTPGIVSAWNKLPVPKRGWMPMGSLLPRYRKSVDAFTQKKKPFLSADAIKVEKYRNQLMKLAAGRPIVGISWQGGYWALQKATKAMKLQDWRQLTCGRALCVNLQYGDVRTEVEEEIRNGASIVSFPDLDFRTDLEDWLAISAACDGIISVSTALVHFAGAIGQKVGIVMPEPQGPWHLGVEDTWHLTYPNVYIFRRDADETDESLVRRVSEAIT